MDQAKLLGLLIGAVIGAMYAAWQLRALARHERMQREQGQAPKVTSMIPGSMIRVAVLLIVLVGVQMLFPKANLLWVAFGVGLAYGIPFLWRLWLMYSRRK